jgi:MFS family permease
MTLERKGWLAAGAGVAAVGWGANQFAPMLVVYSATTDITPTTLQATFALYAVGLIPGLLVGGPVSDRLGRRPVLATALLASALGSLLLMYGGSEAGWLFAGRLISGIASGAAFSSGAAWIRELSVGANVRNPHPGPRRVTIAIGTGFAFGPLVAGAVAEWAPAQHTLPYLPHVAVTAAAIPVVLAGRETRPRRRDGSLLAALRVHGVRDRRFARIVAPLALWVFGPASIALAYLPGLLRERVDHHAIIISAIVIGMTPLAGNLAQPIARRVDHPDKPRLVTVALAITIVGLALAALAASTTLPALIVCAALILGSAYGCCQVCGLQEVQRLTTTANLAGLIAVYQAISYIGFGAPFLLAAIEGIVSPITALLILAGLAALTTLWLRREITNELARPIA